MTADADDAPFWRTTPLAEMTAAEWESLCDGCAKCCLVKLQDIATDDIAYTDVACRLLDLDACRCTDYPNRQRRVPNCVALSPANIDELDWMPSSCAYRLLADGEDLPWWHPLVSGRADSVHLAGISVRGRAVPEKSVPNRALFDRIVTWPE
ncbi:MAG: YcgN family cysteine cluster protein [Alphaproteobacteria bacterium]|nr:YcgN family cysteine cluster protein [Alphaproteobacteria bacterium]